MKRILTLLLFLSCALLAGNISAQKWDWGNGSRKTITGEGPTVSKEIALDNFQSLGLSITADVRLEKGNRQKVVIEAQQNIIDAIERKVKGDSWNITFGDDTRAKDFSKITIYITMPTVRALSLAGSGSIATATPFDGLDAISFSVAGSGNIVFAGSAKSAKISIAGSGDVRAEDLKVTDCKVSIAGSGDCLIDVSGTLKASIAGSGDVRYKGSPRVEISSVGSGAARSMEN